MLTAAVLCVCLLAHCTTLIVATKSAGKCIGPPTNRTTIHEMCFTGNQTDSSTEWHLYPVDYVPYETSGTRAGTFFRIGGINWRCVDLVVRCKTRTQLQMTLRCKQISAVFTVDLRNTTYTYSDSDRCCDMQLQLRPGVNVSRNSMCLYPHSGYELWGHASRILFVQKCHNTVRKNYNINGYWLFVSKNGDTSETRRALQALLKHYPYLRLHSWTTTLANKDSCECASFNNYIVREMQCNSPMFDRSQENVTQPVPRKEEGLRLVNIKNIHIVIPNIVIYTIEGVLVLKGILFCAYISLVRGNVEIEL